MVQPLTRKEKMVLEYIENYLHEEGVAPSFQEIKDHFGFASFNSIQRYLKQLQKKQYIHIPGGNQKRAINVLRSADSLQTHLQNLKDKSHSPFHPQKEASVPRSFHTQGPSPESLSLPLYGRVAAGNPMEAFDHDEFFDVPLSMVKSASHTFALKVEGESMIEEGIFDGDVILVEEKPTADNGELIVATVDNEATVKRFFVHQDESHKKIVELRPANSSMKSMWFSPKDVHIRGRVIGLIRQFK